jgi:uncharacterized protein with PQ loop repeat
MKTKKILKVLNFVVGGFFASLFVTGVSLTTYMLIAHDFEIINHINLGVLCVSNFIGICLCGVILYIKIKYYKKED